MKFQASKETLLEALHAVIGVVERRQTMPILSNVLLELTDGTLTVTGTDLELELRVQTLVDEQGPGRTTVPARKLYDICRSLPEGANISAELSGNRMQIRSGRGRFMLATLAADEFPAQDDLRDSVELRLRTHDLLNVMSRTQFAMAQQDVRYYLNGLHLDISAGRLRAVATDGHRLALSQTEHDVSLERDIQVIVPRKGVTELQRLLDGSSEELELRLTDSAIQIVFGPLRFTSKLIDGRFPDYERVVPASSDKWVTGDRDDLRAALQRAAILSNEKFRGVRLVLNGSSLKLQTHNPEHEEAEEEIEVEYVGEPVEIGFNVNYLLEALGAMETEQFSLGLTDPDHSGLLLEPGNEDSKFVVMPMRL